jgi:hypothetical protein
MTSKDLQRGALGGDGIALMIGATALGGLFVYSAVSGYELPLWPAVAVTVVNLVAAGRLAWTVIKSKRKGR